jgi:hypothetical protein
MRSVEQNPAHGAVHAAFPGVKLDGGGMLPIQARVVFHQERLLYGMPKAHADYIRAAKRCGLPDSITAMDYLQCIIALGCIEAAARRYPVIGRSYDTTWYELAQALPHSIGPRSVNLAAFTAAIEE